MGYHRLKAESTAMIERAVRHFGQQRAVAFLAECVRLQRNLTGPEGDCHCTCSVLAPCERCIKKLTLHAAIAGARTADTPEEWAAVSVAVLRAQRGKL